MKTQVQRSRCGLHIQAPPYERSSACCHVFQLLFKKLGCFSGETGHTYDNKSALHEEFERRGLNTTLESASANSCVYTEEVWGRSRVAGDTHIFRLVQGEQFKSGPVSTRG